MYGAIRRKHECGELFNGIGHIYEVYAALNFDFGDNSVTFVFYADKFFESRKVLDKLSPMWNGNVHVYVVDNPYNSMLAGKRIIWKDGVWFV